MADFRDDRTDASPVRRRGSGGIIALVLVVAALVVALLFATGFWSADVKSGALPNVAVTGGALPEVNVDSKELVVGTTKTEVDVPKIETEKTTIDVPTVGVKDDKE